MGTTLPHRHRMSYVVWPVVLALLLLSTRSAPGQPASWEETGGIQRNRVTVLHAASDTLWVGPRLNVTLDGGQRWWRIRNDALQEGNRSVYALDTGGDAVWVGLARYLQRGETSVPAAGGFLVSSDGGRTFTFRPPPLDEPTDTTVAYGGQLLTAEPAIVPEESPPHDVANDPVGETVWVAAGAAGLRRSTDEGRTWERSVLPPDSLAAIHPDSAYGFALRPRRGDQGSANHRVYSVLVDETGTVWAGTGDGLNRSRPEDEHPSGRAWKHVTGSGPDSLLPASQVMALGEQNRPGRNAVWAAAWPAAFAPGEEAGAVVTRDGGHSYEHLLAGERIYDFAFQGQTVYVAAASGLFLSEDDGRTWRTETTFGRSRPPGRVFATAVTENAVWAGTAEGLFRSTDGGRTWTVFRADVPLDPEEPTEAEPRVQTYAYPNPFTPVSDDLVRLRYRVRSDGAVVIRVFDFSMQLVRELDDHCPGQSERECEAVWDGTDSRGLNVAEGVYFYTVTTDRGTAKGKILLLK